MPFNLSSGIVKPAEFNLPLILCVSGGKDSVCMFHLVMEHLESFKHTPEVVHFNHKLRKDSDADQKFTEELCRKAGIPVKVFVLDVKGNSSEKGLSIEESARELRYAALTEYTSLKKEKGTVFTAHTASDQTETVIFRLVKGTGRTGILGIRPEFKLDSAWRVRRPLLEITAEEVLGYLEKRGLTFREDESNYDISIPRNLIRHRVTGVLKSINPMLDRSFSRQTDIWRAEESFLEDETDRALSGIKITRKGSSVIIELKSILSYNNWLKRRLIRRLSPVDLGFANIDDIVGLLRKPGTASRIDIGSGWKARKGRKKLVFEKEIPATTDFEYGIIPGSETRIKETGAVIKADLVASARIEERTGLTEYFDADSVNIPGLIVRARRPGDRMVPWGLKGSKKLKDMLIDMKLELEQKAELAVIEDGNRILWAAPYRRAAVAPVSGETGRILRLELL